MRARRCGSRLRQVLQRCCILMDFRCNKKRNIFNFTRLISISGTTDKNLSIATGKYTIQAWATKTFTITFLRVLCPRPSNNSLIKGCGMSITTLGPPFKWKIRQECCKWDILTKETGLLSTLCFTCWRRPKLGSCRKFTSVRMKKSWTLTSPKKSQVCLLTVQCLYKRLPDFVTQVTTSKITSSLSLLVTIVHLSGSMIFKKIQFLNVKLPAHNWEKNLIKVCLSDLGEIFATEMVKFTFCLETWKKKKGPDLQED
jgi:hypothetical protein